MAQMFNLFKHKADFVLLFNFNAVLKQLTFVYTFNNF